VLRREFYQTTFSTLVASSLLCRPDVSDEAVVSVFVRDCDVPEAELDPSGDILTKFLELIDQQLGEELKGKDRTGFGLEESSVARTGDTRSDDPRGDKVVRLRAAITDKLSFFTRAFLIVDDLDMLCANPTDYLIIQHELENLQEEMKIMTTSRVPFNRSTEGGTCDAKEEEHDIEDIWWQCVLCMGDEHYICDTCKVEGFGCPTP